MTTHTRRHFIHTTIRSLAALQAGVAGGSACAQQEVASPLRVACVMPAAKQPHQQDEAVVFYDDFATAPDQRARYFEYANDKGSFVWTPDEGLQGGAMRCRFEQGQVSAGSLHVLFGKNPFGRGLRPAESFGEIYWRVYVKHEPGWAGNPAKLARATCLAGRDYSQGFIAHVWGGKGDALCIDPATGIRDGRKMTTCYNDFTHLKWLGMKNGRTPVFSSAESGRWVCVESHIKLNTPGRRDGIFELWVDGKPEAASTDLDWLGTWGGYAINAVYLENYWNQGSVKRQARWFDNFIISRRPIGPIVATATPTILRTRPADSVAWEARIATDTGGADIVWQSRPTNGTTAALPADAAHGVFTGSRAGRTDLAAGTTHWLCVRAAGGSAWSPWHAPFKC